MKLIKNAEIIENYKKRCSSNQNDRFKLKYHIPNTYESYCKIYHPFYIIEEFIDEKYTWTDYAKNKEVRDYMKKKYNYSEDDYNDETDENDFANFTLKPVKWMDYCEKLDIRYTSELNEEDIKKKYLDKFGFKTTPIYFLLPDYGIFNEKLIKNLNNILLKFTVNDCYFFYRFNNNGFLKDLTFKGDLKEFKEIPDKAMTFEYPTYYWEENFKWSVCSDQDLCYSYVGGPKKKIDQILNNNYIESVRSSLNDSII